MSPILVRPVREQLEHDRIIRLLQAKNRRKYDAGINPGAEQNVPVGTGPSAVYPDLVLHSLERGRRLAGDRRSRNRRIGQSPRSARRVGPFRQNSRAVSPVRAVEHGRRRAAAVRRQPDCGQRNLELSRHRRRRAVHAGAPDARGRARLRAADRASPGDRCKAKAAAPRQAPARSAQGQRRVRRSR